MTIDLRFGDCLEVMKNIENGCIDMVLVDPPYGITSSKWDSVIPLEPMWEALKRIVKDNGAIAIMGSQPFTSELIGIENDEKYFNIAKDRLKVV